MPRRARIVIEGMPHHVIQRGNRKQSTFIKESDKKSYLTILNDKVQKYGVKVWAYCLMPNHVHLIVVPESRESLALAIGETHKAYTRLINERENWKGFLWEGRFKSFVMDESYLLNAVRYVERNPVRANLVKNADQYKWSSAYAHVSKEPLPPLSHFYLMDEIADWREYLKKESFESNNVIKEHIKTGLPFGSDKFINNLEKRLGIKLTSCKPGPKPLN